MPFYKKILRQVSIRIFNYIENNNITNFSKNGEKNFIEKLFNYLNNTYANGGGDIILFDIGANVGNYSMMLKTNSNKNNLNYKIHLFEPTQYCFNEILKKFRNKNKFILNNFGISHRNSKSKIYYDNEGSGLASLYHRELKHYSIERGKAEEIMLRRLDEYIEENAIKHINFMKIDIEGHELRAFEGMGDYLNCNFIDFIQFEYGGANLDSHSSLLEIYNLFENRGFNVAKVMVNGLEVRKYKPFMDNFNYANYVAISEKVLKGLSI